MSATVHRFPVQVHPRPPALKDDVAYDILKLAYLNLQDDYALLRDENDRLAERRLWRDVGSFCLGVLAMAVVVVLGRL
jgi:hypothetical protein